MRYTDLFLSFNMCKNTLCCICMCALEVRGHHQAFPVLLQDFLNTHLPMPNRPLLHGVYIPNCTADDVSTHNTPGNDPFTMATTNKKKKIPLVQGKASEEDRYRERELAGSQECQAFWPPLHPNKGLWQLGWKISLLPDVVVCWLPSFRCPPPEYLPFSPP